MIDTLSLNQLCCIRCYFRIFVLRLCVWICGCFVKWAKGMVFFKAIYGYFSNLWSKKSGRWSVTFLNLIQFEPLLISLFVVSGYPVRVNGPWASSIWLITEGCELNDIYLFKLVFLSVSNFLLVYDWWHNLSPVLSLHHQINLITLMLLNKTDI